MPVVRDAERITSPTSPPSVRRTDAGRGQVMDPLNGRIAARLEGVAGLLEDQEANVFRAEAWRRAAIGAGLDFALRGRRSRRRAEIGDSDDNRHQHQ